MLKSKDPYPIDYKKTRLAKRQRSESLESFTEDEDNITNIPSLGSEVDNMVQFLSQPNCIGPDHLEKWSTPHEFQTILKGGENNETYVYTILDSLLANHSNSSTTHKGICIPMYMGGPDHAHIFIAYCKLLNQYYIAPTKKDLTKFIVA